MPAPVIGAAAITGGAQLLQGIGNYFSQKKANKDSRNFSKEMYNLQKRDSIDFWKMQNEYNTPLAQRKRLEEAGLHPLYGQGVQPGNAGAINTPDVKDAQFKAARIEGIADFMKQYQNMKIAQAQTDNIKVDGAAKVAMTIKNLEQETGQDYMYHNGRFMQIPDGDGNLKDTLKYRGSEVGKRALYNEVLQSQKNYLDAGITSRQLDAKIKKFVADFGKPYGIIGDMLRLFIQSSK